MSFSGNASVVASHAALRLLSSAIYQTAFVQAKSSLPDGGGATYAYATSDTSGCVFTASVSGTTLTVTAVANGAVSPGLSVNRGDTGASIGTIVAFGSGTGGAGTYTLSDSDTISSMTFTADSDSFFLVAVDGARWFNVGLHPQTTTEIKAGITPSNYLHQEGDVRRYGALGNGVTDDTAAFQAALNVYTQAQTPGRVRVQSAAYFPGAVDVPSAVYKISSTLTIDASYVTMIGEYATLDCSDITAGDAIVITGTVNPPYGQSRAIFEGIAFRGSGPSSGVNGLHFYASGTGAGPASITVRNCSVTGFGTGEYFDSNAYLISHFDCEIYANGNNVVTAGNPVNAGENINYHGGVIYNTAGYGIWVQGSTYDLHFFGTSVDGCGSTTAGGLIRIDSGELHFHGHLESINGETAIYVPSTANACIITFEGYIAQDTKGGDNPLINIQGPGYLTLLGGRIAAVSGTKTIVNMAAGRFTNWGCHYQYGAGTTPEVISQGVNYVSVEPNNAEFTSNYHIVGGGIVSTTGVIGNDNRSVTVSALNTWVEVLSYPGGGLFIFRDVTLGGTAVFAFDSAVGPVSIQNGISGLQASSQSGKMAIRLSSGTVPRVIRWANLQTNSS